ncbi:MAG: LOG family protein, partial [Gammaproteobacteria bacterium]
QLGLQNKPCGILNVGNYFDTFLNFLDHAVKENFLSVAHRSMILVESSAEKLLQAMTSFTGAPQPRWVEAPSMV